jgi:exonuclease VII small subunit
MAVGLLVALLAPLPASADDEKGIPAEIAALQAQAASLEEAVSALQKQVTSLQSGNTALQKQVDSLQSGDTALQKEVTSLESSNTALQKQVNTLQSSNTTLQKQLATVQSNHALLLGPFVNIDPNPEIGVIGPNIIFSGANIHIVSGSGSTNDNGNPPGLEIESLAMTKTPVWSSRTPSNLVIVAGPTTWFSGALIGLPVRLSAVSLPDRLMLLVIRGRASPVAKKTPPTASLRASAAASTTSPAVCLRASPAVVLTAPAVTKLVSAVAQATPPSMAFPASLVALVTPPATGLFPSASAVASSAGLATTPPAQIRWCSAVRTSPTTKTIRSRRNSPSPDFANLLQRVHSTKPATSCNGSP